MSSSEQRRAANRANAVRSTGPATTKGKAVACRNATRHGLLSTRLLLDDEDPAEFGSLLLDLQSTLAPLGSAELLLVERIAIALWRQRRLVAAESAAIGLAREPHHLARGVSEELHPGYRGKFAEDDLQPFDPERIEFCSAVIGEVNGLEHIDLATLPNLAPTIYGQLKSDAEGEKNGIEGYLGALENGLVGFVAALIEWCHKQLRKAEKRPRLLALAQQMKTRRLVLPETSLEVLSRYQTTLDSQLYKALRALREAQAWRLKTLEAEPQPGPADVGEIAQAA